MLLNPSKALAAFALLASLAAVAAQGGGGGVRVNFAFTNAGASCEVELTGDSVRVRRDDPFAPRPHFSAGRDSLELGRRALTAGEKDSTGLLLDLAKRWKGYKRFACAAEDGYGFSLWTDSLLINCQNCFSCTGGMGMGEARMLEKFGRYTLWMYRMKDEWIK
jgi:hypothetical protein